MWVDVELRLEVVKQSGHWLIVRYDSIEEKDVNADERGAGLEVAGWVEACLELGMSCQAVVLQEGTYGGLPRPPVVDPDAS